MLPWAAWYGIRRKFCALPLQRRFFALQLPLALESDLPLYAHVRGEGCCEKFFSPWWSAWRRRLQTGEACKLLGGALATPPP